MEQTTESSTVDRGSSRFGTAQAASQRRLQPVPVLGTTQKTARAAAISDSLEDLCPGLG